MRVVQINRLLTVIAPPLVVVIVTRQAVVE
jgi:hypothetical protein